MLIQVDVTSEQGELLSLPLQSSQSGYQITEIDGLDPVNASLSSSKVNNMPGARYLSSYRETREIIMTINLDKYSDNGTVEDLRVALYRFFMPGYSVKMKFIMSDGLVVESLGRVKICTAPLFSKTPKVICSIECFDPDFIALETKTIKGFSVSNAAETLIQYDGTINTGFELTLRVNRTIKNIVVYHRSPGGILSMLEHLGVLYKDDIVFFSTLANQRKASVIRNGAEISLLSGMSPYSTWMNLNQGDNYIRVYTNLPWVQYTLEYVERYGGL